jgi:porin
MRFQGLRCAVATESAPQIATLSRARPAKIAPFGKEVRLGGGRTATIGFAALAWAAAAPAHAQDPPALQLSAVYTGEAWRNLQGGLRRGSVYLENLELAADLDAEHAVGWRGASVHVSGFHNDDSTLSGAYVGDLQSVSGKDAPGKTRLYEAWVRQAIGRSSVKGGVVDLNSEFSVTRTALVFVNGAQGLGLDLTQAGREGPSVFPQTGLGLIGEAPVDGHWWLKLGVFDGRPDGGRLRIDAEDGALVIGELAHEASDEMRFATGIWLHTGRFERMDLPLQRRASVGAYVVAERPLARFADRSLDGFARLGVADGKVEEIGISYAAGVVLRGRLLGLEDERLGLGVTAAENGRPFRRARAAAGTPVDRAETAIELTYRAQLRPWLAVQPDVQYVINPGTDPARRNAFVAGLRFEVSWTAASGR